jgi:O-succinylbenzoic acid--CoA ligase
LLEPERLRAWASEAAPLGGWPTLVSPPNQVVVFTSGSTGAPRGARLGLAALAAAAEAHARAIPFTPDDAWLGAMPLSHVGGLSLLTRCLAFGARAVLADRFEPVAFSSWFLRHHRERGADDAGAPPRPAGRPPARRCGGLRGAAFPRSMRRAARSAGSRQTYGLTESARVATSVRRRAGRTTTTAGRRFLTAIETSTPTAARSPQVGRAHPWPGHAFDTSGPPRPSDADTADEGS